MRPECYPHACATRRAGVRLPNPDCCEEAEKTNLGKKDVKTTSEYRAHLLQQHSGPSECTTSRNSEWRPI
eukprot:m.63633 g.63633  ORF g.63633 m.63633 type:complete len:70 (-) comp13974_c0_seq3:3034-3243(-)